MHNQSRNEEYLEQHDVAVTKLEDALHTGKETKTLDTPKIKLNTEGEATSTPSGVPNSASSSSNRLERMASEIVINETTVIGLISEDHIDEGANTTQQKTTELSAESVRLVPDCESDVVGDDFSKKSDVHILCECEPNVAGAAVPTVTSFIPNDSRDSAMRCNKSDCSLPEGDIKENPDKKSETTPVRNKELAKPTSKIAQKIKSTEIEKHFSNTTNQEFKCSQPINRCFKPAVETVSAEVKGHAKRPSLIPKPTRLSNINYKFLDKEDVDKQEHVKLDIQRNSSKSCLKIKETSPGRSCKIDSKAHSVTNANTISSRMMGLQERLKATTSMLRQKIEMDKSKEKIASKETCNELVEEEEKDKEISSLNKKTVYNLYRNISSLKNIAAGLSESSTLNNQTKYIERLFRNISEIKSIADKLCMVDQSTSKQNVLVNTNDSVIVEKDKTPKSSLSNTKDNKIYIKFMHSKDRKSDKKKSRELARDHSEEVQTDVSLSSKLASELFKSDTCVAKKSQEEDKVKEADSMDGIFIPSCEPPKNMEEEEETNGLDITITFPEFSQLYSNGAESHLSVCLSDISAEALKKLKRCPKDFTLKMDFVEGKVLFQSGKGPTNNFQIGPDLKFAENIVDTKKSDVISIKPSTECSFGSQLIPVENARENKSYRSLKSADSEVFNVVSLPFLYKNPYLAANHKSCITFRNDQIMSMAIVAKHIFKSMPQIPSLTNIFEDKIMESPSKTVCVLKRDPAIARLRRTFHLDGTLGLLSLSILISSFSDSGKKTETSPESAKMD